MSALAQHQYRELFRHQEVVSMLWTYADKRNLVPSNDKSVVEVDALLVKVMGKAEGTRVKKSELAKKYVPL